MNKRDKKFNFDEIETNVITKKQTPETDVDGIVYFLADICLFASIISTIVYLIVRGNFLRPYYRLLKVAMRNDDVRHEERIRFRERKRLEEDYDIEVSMRDKDKLEKQRDKSIAEMEKIDQKNELGDVRESTYKTTTTKPAFKIPPYKKPE